MEEVRAKLDALVPADVRRRAAEDHVAADDPDLAKLFAAVAAGEPEVVAELVGRRPALAAARDADGETPLHAAARFDDSQLAALLVAYGADVNAKLGQSGHTAISWAVTCNALDCADAPEARRGGRFVLRRRDRSARRGGVVVRCERRSSCLARRRRGAAAWLRTDRGCRARPHGARANCRRALHGLPQSAGRSGAVSAGARSPIFRSGRTSAARRCTGRISAARGRSSRCCSRRAPIRRARRCAQLHAAGVSASRRSRIGVLILK